MCVPHLQSLSKHSDKYQETKQLIHRSNNFKEFPHTHKHVFAFLEATDAKRKGGVYTFPLWSVLRPTRHRILRILSISRELCGHQGWGNPSNSF